MLDENAKNRSQKLNEKYLPVGPSVLLCMAVWLVLLQSTPVLDTPSFQETIHIAIGTRYPKDTVAMTLHSTTYNNKTQRESYKNDAVSRTTLL